MRKLLVVAMALAVSGCLTQGTNKKSKSCDANVDQAQCNGNYAIESCDEETGQWQLAETCPPGTECSDLADGPTCRAPPCKIEQECPTGVCIEGECVPANCTDGAKNGDETDIDCGGSCPTTCGEGETCKVNGDCNTDCCGDGTCITKTPEAACAAPPPPRGEGPEIKVNPSVLDFGKLSEGQQADVDISIVNTGDKALEVTGFRLSGPTVFTLITVEGEWKASDETAAGIEFAEVISIDPGKNHLVKVRFSPNGPEPAEGEVRFFSNDPALLGQGAPVILQGNLGGACITVNPPVVDFGGKLVGKLSTIEVQITSCGDSALTISGMELVDDVLYSNNFGLDLTDLGLPVGTSSLGPEDAPVVLGVNESATFKVTFIPDAINVLDDSEGLPIPDLGLIQILSNTFVAELQVEVRGFGVEQECPTAVIKAVEGNEVIPQTKLHLIGSQSYAASGAISKYEWTVEQPLGSQSVFFPSDSTPEPIFEVNVAGKYEFRLKVWDSEGTPSCIEAEYQVNVLPDEAIHVEVLWDTPDDPDQTDEGPEAGADLDLHFLHPFAMELDLDGDGEPDGWFDSPFDCFWFNSQPNWASLDPALDDDPSLDRDDTDGVGPENLNLNLPEDGAAYRIGVHYWNDHEHGPSYVTVRIYIMSALKKELTDVKLVNHDMWFVGYLEWPGGEFTQAEGNDGGYHITPKYVHPFFVP